VQGSERQNVKMAFETISSTVAKAMKFLDPEKSRKSEFIQLANDFFDVLNSRRTNESSPLKKPLGMCLTSQFVILDMFEEEIQHLKVGKSKALFPFQKGLLMTIRSLKSLFNDLRSGPLQVKYLYTARLNQDLAENAFSILRSFGTFKHTMDAVDAKYRLRMLALSWHLMSPKSTASVAADPDFEEAETVSSRIIGPLMEDTTPKTDFVPIPDSIEDSFMEISCHPSATVNGENWKEFSNKMAPHQEAEFGGIEYVAGYLCSKFGPDCAEMVLPPEEASREPLSWSQAVSDGNLKIPGYKWLNLVRKMDRYFVAFHAVPNCELQINKVSTDYGIAQV
jgi:hypothetical protein